MGRSDTPYHTPVMTEAVVDLLRPLAPGTIVDATFGGGGHSRALLMALPGIRIIGIDRDPDAAVPAGALGGSLILLRGDFRNLEELLIGEGLHEIDGALFDLGVSSHQLDLGDRGFSFHRRGPLDMRMGPDAPLTADEIVNGWDERRLSEALRHFGEEPSAARIAAAIVRSRPISDTEQLAEIVAGAVPARFRRTGHPARRTFQALRIAVNDELAALRDGLDAALRLLRPGGRIAVISYHSLEDRIVKRRLVAGATGCICPPDLPVCGCGRSAELRLLNRRPIVPSEEEVAANARARSARLRAAERMGA
jgi:16S rRNA (cytosine1402-N4)-methyltransferase